MDSTRIMGDLAAETFLDGRVALRKGDCRHALRHMAENSVDAVICDPPYHLHSIVRRFAKTGRTESTASTSGPHQRTAKGFMGKRWDGGDIAFRRQTWEAVLRVLKPGGYLLAFSSCRTYHRMATAIEDAGAVIHPFLAWMFATGMPLGAHRVQFSGLSDLDRETEGWAGWRYGAQALKPAIEPICFAQKPFSEPNGSLNVQRWGVGAINIEGCKVHSDDAKGGYEYTVRRLKPGASMEEDGDVSRRQDDVAYTGFKTPGRWPANVVLSHVGEVLAMFPESDGAAAPVTGNEPTALGFSGNVYGAPGTARRALSDQRDGGGSAARFFFTAKADDDDRLGSKHPTVKPIDLMRWLCRLVTPPKGIILDPFAGTGTTAEAAFYEGFNAALVERETEYCAAIRTRMAAVLAGPDERRRLAVQAAGKLKADPGPLFSR